MNPSDCPILKLESFLFSKGYGMPEYDFFNLTYSIDPVTPLDEEECRDRQWGVKGTVTILYHEGNSEGLIEQHKINFNGELSRNREDAKRNVAERALGWFEHREKRLARKESRNLTPKNIVRTRAQFNGQAVILAECIFVIDSDLLRFYVENIRQMKNPVNYSIDMLNLIDSATIYKNPSREVIRFVESLKMTSVPNFLAETFPKV